MIISPPFLPDPRANETDEAFVARAMTTVATGKFPVSHYLQWHGGIHIQAPTADTPVRAIADGRIVYLRQPTARPDNQEMLEQHPLYHPQQGWTDNGCIVIRHETEIGENITVVYYSIYMHLSTIENDLAQGNNIHRKTHLGRAGQIYGQQNLIHFEIITADNQIENIVGALTLNRNGANYHTNQQGHITHYTSQHGRTACCFANMYFYLPANTPTYTGTHATNRYTHAATGNTLGQALYLEMKYHSGSCTFTAYDENGTQVGQPITTNSNSPNGSIHEYNLYAQSSRVCANMPTAGFELLRFGRVLGTEELNPANTAHYRQIPTANGNTWVNLNTDAIKKYSDADFPFWKGWSVVEDDTNNDSRCDSAIVTAILDNGEVGSFATLSDTEKQTRLAEESIQNKLKKIFYKFYTEWQNDNFEARFGWLKNAVEEGGRALSDDDFAWFQNHVQAQAFWEAANLEGIEANHWHCPPIAFIQHFRKCGWLNQSEIKQLIPSHAIRGNYWEGVNIERRHRETMEAVVAAMSNNLNKILRKYCINTPLRMACFFGNAIQEAGWFRALQEGSPTSQWYYPWHGRGLLQLTHPENYERYWQFRARTIPQLFTTLKDEYARVEAIRAYNPQRRVDWAETNRRRVAARTAFQDNVFPRLNQCFTWRDQVAHQANIDPVDSAGFYWAQKRMASYADETHTLERRIINANNNLGVKVYYRSMAFWRASAAVNLPGAVNNTNYSGLNGFDQRCSVYGNCLAVLTEIKFPAANGQLTLEFPEGYTRRDI